MRMQNRQFIGSVCLILSCFLPLSAWATPDYAENTKQGCLICHVEEDGGELNEEGLTFSASGYVWPPEGGYRLLGPIRKSIRFFLGVLHIVAGFMWFGTILYVHLILKPAYALRGLPKGEVALGMISMAVVGITGIFLTISKIRGLDVLFSSPWGITLFVKILLYIIMVSSAMVVVFFVGPRLRKGQKTVTAVKPAIFDPETLASFDGKNGKQALIAFKDNVYDVTDLKLWKNGAHMKHSAGYDLTEMIAKAPHGEEKLAGLPVAGKFDASRTPSKTPAQKAFYFVAYMNLVIVFMVLVVIAYWRWGI